MTDPSPVDTALRDAHAKLSAMRQSDVGSTLDYYVRMRSRHGIIYPGATPEPAPTACAYCDAKLAPPARKCDNCGAAVKEDRRG